MNHVFGNESFCPPGKYGTLSSHRLLLVPKDKVQTFGDLRKNFIYLSRFRIHPPQSVAMVGRTGQYNGGIRKGRFDPGEQLLEKISGGFRIKITGKRIVGTQRNKNHSGVDHGKMALKIRVL